MEPKSEHKMVAFDERASNLAAIQLFVRLDGRKSAVVRERFVRESLALFGISERRAVARVLELADNHPNDGEGFKRKYGHAVKGALHSQNTGIHRMVA